MKQTAKEKLVQRFTRLGKKNKWARRLLLPFLFIALAGISLLNYFISNGKKYACIVAALLFFVMSSSFSFPIFEDMELSSQSMAFVAEDVLWRESIPEEVYTPLEEASEETEVLDDQDVLDGYEDIDLENMIL